MPAVRDVLNLTINALGSVNAAGTPSRVGRSGGKVSAERHTENGWQGLESMIGLGAGKESEIRLECHRRGALTLDVATRVQATLTRLAVPARPSPAPPRARCRPC